MSIETLITGLTDALNANTEALRAAVAGGAVAAGSAEKSTGRGKGAGKAGTEAAPKITQEEMNAALVKIKDDFGMPHAKEIIKGVGGVEKMADIKPAKYQEVYDAAVKKHAELTEAGKGGGDDDDI